MSADPVIYCLEHLTDYHQFERLCSDVMAGSGYPNIDPLGGTGDRGRDALQYCRTNPGELTIFAYSVRSDWWTKLEKDCLRIEEEKHNPAAVVFVCTETITASRKDQAKAAINKRFGWHLELFDLERLRVRLAGDLRHLVAQHPSIFCPPWFPARGGLSISESHDTVIIDHVNADHAFATWLSRRLQLAGYRTWSYGTAPLAGDDADDSVRQLVRQRAQCYLPVLSTTSVANADLMGRCALASGLNRFTIPCWSAAVNDISLARRLRELSPVRFDRRWSSGLSDLLSALQANGIAPSHCPEQGRSIALRSYVPEALTRPTPESVFANVFRATVPAGIVVCEIQRPLEKEEEESLRREWAFAVATPTMLLSFGPPPQSVPLVPKQRLPEYSWSTYNEKHGRVSVDVVKELLRRSLDVACFQAGLAWCGEREAFYFADGDAAQRRVNYRHVDGRQTWKAVTGDRTYGSGERAKPFRYQLGPAFRPGRDEDGNWWVTMRIYVRVTEVNGTPFEGKLIGKRRKSVTKNWWNKEWLELTLAVMQGVSQGATEIVSGTGHRKVAVSTAPLEWLCPISIDYEAVERVGDFQEEMAAMRYVDDTDEDDDVTGDELEPPQ